VRAIIIAAVLLAFGVATWVERDRVLLEAAALWIVSDPVTAADVAVVLGGGVEDRPFAAAAYYRAGLVKKILVSNAHQGPAEKLGVVMASASTDKAVLLKLGVPMSAIEIFGEDLKNTDDEAVALHAWAVHNGIRSAIVPSEIFSARRVRWIMRRVLGDDVAVSVPALDTPDYGRNDWWQHEKALLEFQNEMVKYIYYRIKY
jgi:uncharacterized SAM-binding protein YcdF (DUF218 family)